MWPAIFIFLNVVFVLQGENVTERRWSEKQWISLNNISSEELNPRKPEVKRKIVLYHNFFRSKVAPSASNMMLMSWSSLAARQAQAYAEQCQFLAHNRGSQRVVPRLGACGQNLYASTEKTPWFFAMKAWYLEYKNFTYGKPIKDLNAVGHYTQMIWATSHKVGCGLALCKGGPWDHFYNYVCHYCPSGNIIGINHYPYKSGLPCEDCPKHCVSKTLCSNTCIYTDFYNNCNEITKVDSSICKTGNCNATCSCGASKLYKNHPWQ